MEAVIAKAMELLSSVEGASVTVALVLDFAFRMIPSQKPLSVLHLVSKIAGMVGMVLIKLAEISDKVLPQKIKE